MRSAVQATHEAQDISAPRFGAFGAVRGGQTVQVAPVGHAGYAPQGPLAPQMPQVAPGPRAFEQPSNWTGAQGQGVHPGMGGRGEGGSLDGRARRYPAPAAVHPGDWARQRKERVERALEHAHWH